MTMTMIATYKRPNKLNVREKPNPNAKVLRQMHQGDSAECIEVSDGWCRLADGFVNVAYVLITIGETMQSAIEKIEAVTESIEVDGTASADDAEPVETMQSAIEERPTGEDEAAELRKMTNPQLYDLAAKSGVKVRKGANKDELIAAILGDE